VHIPQHDDEPTPTLTELFGTQSERSSVRYAPSLSQHWFDDAELANSHAVDSRPPMSDGVVLRYNYPRPLALVPSIFTERAASRTLSECNSVFVQQFSDGGLARPTDRTPRRLAVASLLVRSRVRSAVHWHNLVLFGPTRKAFLWEPAQINLEAHARDAIAAAFEAAPKADGWTLETIELHLQSDSWQCGPWSHWFRCRAFAYAAQCMGSDDDQGFKHFLAGSDGVQPMDGLRRTSKASGRANGELMQMLRGKLAVLLQSAHGKGVLPWEYALHDAFRHEEADATPRYIDLDEDDE